jgi:hypothetical protein
MYLDFHLYFMIKSYLSQVFRPASFGFAKIFTRMTNTTPPCSIGRSAPFLLFFVPSTTRFAPPLNCPHRAFINARHYSFKSKSNLNTLRRRVYHVVFSTSSVPSGLEGPDGSDFFCENQQMCHYEITLT